MITKKKFIGYEIKFLYIDAYDCLDFWYKHCDTMLEIPDDIDELKNRYGEKLKAIILETHEEIEI